MKNKQDTYISFQFKNNRNTLFYNKLYLLLIYLLVSVTILFVIGPKSAVAQDQCTVTEVFDFTGAAQTFTVPANVSLITINAWGAEGGTVLAGTNPGFGGLGGAVLGSQLAVTPGETLDVFVGGTPNPASHGPGFPDPDPAATTPGGFNGGGDGGSNAGSNTFHGGGGGGGASDVRRSSDILVIAGGGGGGSHGGGGGNGGEVGDDGEKTGDDISTQGTGGTNSAGGNGGQGGAAAADTDGQDGSALQGGNGGNGGDGGGGGGGGWFGGGGGGGGNGTPAGGGAGGGGGSSFSIDNVNTTFESGENDGDGLVEISYQRPGCVTEIQLNEGPCWRMLSSPVDGLTYNQFLGDLWTQGFPGADYDDGVPNVYLWNTNEAGIGQTGWVAPGNLNDVIPPGSGFLISVFTDDEHGTPGTWPKTLDVTGTGDEHVPLTFTNMNTNSDGWTLIGNPFLTPIDFAELNTTDISGVAYIYDRNLTGPFDGVDTNNNTGGWRTTDGMYGDVIDGIISPFQGFFVQNDGTGPSVEFTDNSRNIGGEFYGKQRERNNFVRLEVRGKELYNSMWVRFSNDGSFERTHGDALKLMPLAEEYALLGSRKVDGTLTDIGHFPEPNEEAVIPVSFQTTQSGSYTIIATDLDIPAGVNLYLIDLQTNQSVRIDGEFEYTFSASQATKSTPDQNGIIPCQASPQMAAKTTGDDRFVITTSAYIADSELPVDVSLSQNYPNPFNPTTVIRYELPQQADVRIEVFDMSGRRVATLVEGSVQAGVHTVTFDASHLSSGVYLYSLQTDGVALTRKLTLIK